MHTYWKASGFVYERFICLVLDAYSWDLLASEKPAQMSNVSLRYSLESGCMTCLSKYGVSFLLEYPRGSPTSVLFPSHLSFLSFLASAHMIPSPALISQFTVYQQSQVLSMSNPHTL